jgi:hypothetical protein
MRASLHLNLQQVLSGVLNMGLLVVQGQEVGRSKAQLFGQHWDGR